MNETTEMWREVRKDKQERHAKLYQQNKSILVASGIPFEDKGETLLFRQPNKPKVDFYPSTGRWKYKNDFMRGGAKAFLEWYRKVQG